MGFVGGVLSDVQRNFLTKRAEEAEAQKEARLAAIRAQERGEDRQFQQQQFEAQSAAQAERDSRLDTMQVARDDKRYAHDDAKDQRDYDQRVKEMNQSASDSAANRNESRASRVAAAKAAKEEREHTEQTTGARAEKLFIDPKTQQTFPKPQGVTDTDFMLSMKTRHQRELLPYTPTMYTPPGEDGGLMGQAAKPKPAGYTGLPPISRVK